MFRIFGDTTIHVKLGNKQSQEYLEFLESDNTYEVLHFEMPRPSLLVRKIVQQTAATANRFLCDIREYTKHDTLYLGDCSKLTSQKVPGKPAVYYTDSSHPDRIYASLAWVTPAEQFKKDDPEGYNWLTQTFENETKSDIIDVACECGIKFWIVRWGQQ